MKSDRSKVAFEVCGRAIVRHVVDAVRGLSAKRIVVVVGHGRDEVEAALAGVPGVTFAVQTTRRGTADATKVGMRALGKFKGTVLVLSGDVPLIRTATLRSLVTRHRRAKAAASILSVDLDAGGAYGRILRDARRRFVAIREAKDCTRDELRVSEINSGLYAFDAESLRSGLRAVRANNAQGEYYVTDVPEILLRRGEKVQAVAVGTRDELLGVNTFAELAAAGARLRLRILEDLMKSGVEIRDPSTTYVEVGSKIGRGTRILPFSTIERDVVVGKGCEVGPYARLRPGTVLEDGAEIGNFVETKKARIGKGAKAKHLTYLGDAEIGAGTNVGCGTITANYDGTHKHRTVVEADVHIGSGTVLIAPVRVGRGATTGAGAIVPAGCDVAAGDTVVGVPARSLVRSSGPKKSSGQQKRPGRKNTKGSAAARGKRRTQGRNA